MCPVHKGGGGGGGISSEDSPLLERDDKFVQLPVAVILGPMLS